MAVFHGALPSRNCLALVHALFEQTLGHRDFPDVEELVVCDAVADGTLINLDVRQQFEQISPGFQVGSQVSDFLAQFIKTGFELERSASARTMPLGGIGRTLSAKLSAAPSARASEAESEQTQRESQRDDTDDFSSSSNLPEISLCIVSAMSLRLKQAQSCLMTNFKALT